MRHNLANQGRVGAYPPRPLAFPFHFRLSSGSKATQPVCTNTLDISREDALSDLKSFPYRLCYFGMVQSATKPWLRSMSEAQRIIDTAFPNKHQVIVSIGELLDGVYNSSYLISLQDGNNYVLKIAPPPDVRVLRSEAFILEAEASILRLIREKTSVPVPELIVYDDTCEIFDSPYILMSHLPGVTLDKLRPSLSTSESDTIDHTIGRYIHQVGDAASGRQYFGRGPNNAKIYLSWRECFLALTEAILRDGEDMLVLLPYEQLRQQFRRWAYTLDEVVQPRLSILDFGDGSTLVDPQTKTVTGLIDFERSGWFDPLLSAAFRGPSPALVEGYGTDVLDTKNKKCRSLLYSCYYSSVKIVETYYHQAENGNEMEERKNLISCLNSLVNWMAE